MRKLLSDGRSIRVVAVLCGLSLMINIWGIKRDLPHVAERDETFFVIPAYAMAVNGTWDPKWYGHPGSTMIYPLRMVFALWIATAHGGEDFMGLKPLEAMFKAHSHEYYLLARLLSIAFMVGTVPILYGLARRWFDPESAFFGTLLWIVMPLPVSLAQFARTDTAVLFFGLLFVDLLVRWMEEPTLRRRVMLAVVLSLSLSSNLKMGFLLPLWLGVEVYVWRRNRLRAAREALTWFLAACGSAFLFFLFNPFLVLNWEAFTTSLRAGVSDPHPGAEGGGFFTNLGWYLFEALPTGVGWLVVAAALPGLWKFFRSRPARAGVVLSFIVLYLAEISLVRLHWVRWMSLLTPWLALFAVFGVFSLARHFTRRRWRFGLALLLYLLIFMPPARSMVMQNIRHSTNSTRVRALEWFVTHVPEGSKVAYEWYSVPLEGRPYEGTEMFSIANREGVGFYRSRGFDVLVVSSSVSDRFVLDPGNFPKEAAFYRELERTVDPTAVFSPSPFVDGSEIRVYDLRQSPSAAAP